MKRAAALCALLLLQAGLATAAEPAAPELDGYLQTRFDSTGGNAGFSVRRAKLWLSGDAPGEYGISYKLQGVYRSFKDTGFYFQDAYLQKSVSAFTLRAGRFVPDFSAQRAQPDSFIPVLERALVVNGFSFGHDGSAREAGAQAAYEAKNKNLYLSAGAFNADQNVPGTNSGTDLLYVSKAEWRLLQGEDYLRLGLSGAARHLERSSLFPLSASTAPVSGSDRRGGFSISARRGAFEAQGEYLGARSAGKTSWGSYAYVAGNFYGGFQALGQLEAYKPWGAAAQRWGTIGFNYLLSQKNKVMADYRFRTDSGRRTPEFRVQLQGYFK
jgi:phosphate-selective porin